MFAGESKRSSRWIYAIPVLIAVCGLSLSTWLLKDAGLGKYPALIADAYRDERHHLSVPGAKEVKLTRAGAYGIYYLYRPKSTQAETMEIPPEIECSLKSKSTGAEIEAVPDYVETNRYKPSPDVSGVLIMSLTVGDPDTYTFSCRRQENDSNPETVVALGPNYSWEFLKVVWKIGFPLLGGTGIACTSLFLALAILIAILLMRHPSEQSQTN